MLQKCIFDQIKSYGAIIAIFEIVFGERNDTFVLYTASRLEIVICHLMKCFKLAIKEGLVDIESV